MLIFKSCIIYMGAIIAMIILANCFQKFINSIKKIYNIYIKNIIIVFIIAIITMPLIILSGMRADSVGVDTYNYINIFEMASNYVSFWEFYDSRGREDVLFCLYTYIVRNLINSRFIYLGGLQFLTLVPIVKIAIDEYDKVPLWKSIFVFTCWYFTDSLNAMRQYIAVAFLLLMFKELTYRKYKKVIICLLIACGFHTSAMLMGPILILLCNVLRMKSFLQLKYVVLVLCFLIISFGQNIIVYIFRLGFMPSRWILYINTFIFQNSRMTDRWRILTSGHYFELAIRGVILLCIIFFCSNSKYQKRDMSIYKYLFWLNILIYGAGIFVYHTSYAVRMSVFFDSFIIFLFPILDENFSIKIKIKESKIPIFSAIISITYWFIHSILIGSGGAIPYVIF